MVVEADKRMVRATVSTDRIAAVQHSIALVIRSRAIELTLHWVER